MDTFNPNHYLPKLFEQEKDLSNKSFSYFDYIKNNNTYSYNKALYDPYDIIKNNTHYIIPLDTTDLNLNLDSQNNIIEFIGNFKSVSKSNFYLQGNNNIFLYQNNMTSFLTYHNLYFEISENSHCKFFLINNPQNSKIKNNFYFTLQPNSFLDFEILTITENEQYQDDSIIITHLENSQSNINYKSFNNGTCVSQVNSIILEKSFNANTEQHLKHIMLSPSAKVFSKPNLEIFNPNVKASHGNSIGSINYDESIYLAMRGISIEKYLQLITDEAKHNFYQKVKNKLSI